MCHKTGHVATEVIGDYTDIVPLLAECAGFFINPYVATTVSKIGGGGQHKNFQLFISQD
jgi:hypothetical protein